MVDQLYPEISKKDFEKILKKLAISKQKEDRETLKRELTSQKNAEDSVSQSKETPSLLEETLDESKKGELEGSKDTEIDKKVSQIEGRAVSLIITHLQKKGYPEEFIKRNIDLIEDAVYDILYG